MQGKRDFRNPPSEAPSYPAFDARRRRLLGLLGLGAISVMARGGCMPMVPAPADTGEQRDAGRPDAARDQAPPGEARPDLLPDGRRSDIGDS